LDYLYVCLHNTDDLFLSESYYSSKIYWSEKCLLNI